MRVMISLLLLCSASWAQSSLAKLPPSARAILNQRIPGWKFIDVSPEVRQFFTQYMPAGSSPVLIEGDFDANRRRDYAALVYANSRRYLIIFLARRAGYKMHVFEEPAADYLMLAKKGTGGYNYEKQKKISYSNDVIVTVIFEKGGSSYVFRNGRFVSFVSID